MKTAKMSPTHVKLQREHADLQKAYDELKAVMDDGLSETRAGLEVLAERARSKEVRDELLSLMTVEGAGDMFRVFVCRWCRCWLEYDDSSTGHPEEDHAPNCFAVEHLGRPTTGKSRVLATREPRRMPRPVEPTPVTPATMLGAAIAEGVRNPLQPPRRRRRRFINIDDSDLDESW